MKPYEIVTRRITVFNGNLAEIPADAPAGLRTWTCHAFFVPGTKPDDLRKKITLQYIDVTQVEGGCWVYGGHFWLERTRKDLGLAQRARRG